MAPFGTQIGLNQYVGSGTPLTTYVRTINPTEVFVEGRGDMGRTPMLATPTCCSRTNSACAARNRMRFELNVLNLFNQKTVRHRFNLLNRNRSAASINLANQDLAKRYDYNAMIDGTTDGQERNRQRAAVWHGRPVERGHDGALHGEVPVLGS